MAEDASSNSAQEALFAKIGAVHTAVWSTLAVILIGTLINRLTGLRYPASLPRIREKKGTTTFSLRTRLAYYTDAKKLYRDAYEQYSKKGKTCLIPGLGFKTDVIVPGAAIRWITSQPDSVLSYVESALDIDQIEHSVGHRKFVEDGWQSTVLRRDLNSNLETVAPDVWDETCAAIDYRFGDSTTKFKTVHLYDSMKLIIAQASSRFTVSRPLCRNEAYLKNSIEYSDWFVIEAGLIGILPKSWRHYFGSTLALPMRYYEYFIKRELKSTIKERMELLETQSEGPEPLDHLQMMLKFARKNRPQEYNVNDMVKRVSISNIGSIHQSSIAITNAIFNILESDAKYDTIAQIRTEISEFFAEGGNWTKASIAKMYKLDSIIRETLRINSFGNRGVMRQVNVDNLVTEDGFLLPKGAEVSILGHPAATDPDVFPNPDEFDPFRFSRLREASKDSSSQYAFVSTGPTHLAFGHGKHACPGRFILDFELKMALCAVFGRYELKFPAEYKGKRPPLKWVAEAQMLPSWGDVVVRKLEEGLC